MNGFLRIWQVEASAVFFPINITVIVILSVYQLHRYKGNSNIYCLLLSLL